MAVGKELGILFSVMFLPGLVTAATGVDPSAWTSMIYLVAVLAMAIPQILLVVYVCDLRTPGFSSKIGWVRPRVRDLVTLAIAVVSIFVAVMIWRLIVLTGIVGEGESAVSWSSPGSSLFPMAVLASVAVGYREEIFYRAYLIERAAEHRVPQWAVVTVSTGLFAAGHVYQGVAGVGISALVGLAMAGVYIWRRSLHGIAVAHGIYNVVVLYASQI